MHAHPELQYDLPRTAELVSEKLREFGCDEVVTGIGRSGVVGVIRSGEKATQGKCIGMRADMDALPMTECTGLPYRSTIAGRMHACGHDGHTAMLLGAAKYLAETRQFQGTAVVIFQPAEEGGAGARAMMDDGLMERFRIQEVYGMHNLPGLETGSFGLRAGPVMAAADTFVIDVEGIGGHAAWPHLTVDPVVVGAQIVSLCQTIVSRNTDPIDAAVVSITMFHAGDTNNVIPQHVQLQGTARSLRSETRSQIERRLREIVEGTARMHGAKASLSYNPGYPAACNHPAQTALAAQVAAEVSGEGRVCGDLAPMMSSEDFAYMLESRPGAYIFLGNGSGAGWHHPEYDFNDQVIPAGTAYWARLAERALRAT
jgi:hippurate hydrolase